MSTALSQLPFSQLSVLKKLWPSEPSTPKYEQLPQPVELGQKLEACEENRLDEQQLLRKDYYRPRYLSSLWISLACVITITIAFAVYWTLSHKPSQAIRPITSRPDLPLKVHYKSEIVKSVDCDPPVQIVQSENEAHIVVWPNPAMDLSTYDALKARRDKPWQLHAFWSLENGEYYENLKVAREKLAAGDPKAFDLEVTYKTSSDFPIPYAYSFIDLRKKPLPFEYRRQDKLVAVFISNCSPKNNRTGVLDELMRLLPGQVDSFGGCRNNANPVDVIDRFNWNPSLGQDPPKPLEGWNQKMRIIEHYKFTVAFENADEEDYVTEKYYQALSAGSIPIQLGQTIEQFEKFKPSPNSALNVADFKTVDELAKRIKEIGDNRAEFNRMLEWKSKPYSARFEQILSWGKDHETCRMAKFVQNTWQNPYASNSQRYQSLRHRLGFNVGAAPRSHPSSASTS